MNSTGTGQIDTLPPLRDVIERYDLAPKKSLGQNFILDLNLTMKIARVAGPLEGITVVEVGPGPGGLTRALLAAGAEKIIAVEKDHRAIAALQEVARHYPGRLDIVEGDALDFDAAKYFSSPRREEVGRGASSEAQTPSPHPDPPPKGEGKLKTRIIANLPYNVATPLLTGWLTDTPWPPWFDCMVLMFQKEVAERIVASPGNKVYGRLSVLAQALCDCAIAFDVPPQAFTPPPKVTSSVVYLKPKPSAVDVPRKALEDVTRAAFGQRRRMLRQSLKQIMPEPEAFLIAHHIDPQKRAEQLTIQEFVELAKTYSNISQN